MSFGKTKATAGDILPEFSKFDCLPGRAGGWSFYIFPVQAEENACLCGRNMFQLY